MSAAWKSVYSKLLSRCTSATHLDRAGGLVPELVELVGVLDRFIRDGQVQQWDVDLVSALAGSGVCQAVRA